MNPCTLISVDGPTARRSILNLDSKYYYVLIMTVIIILLMYAYGFLTKDEKYMHYVKRVRQSFILLFIVLILSILYAAYMFKWYIYY